MQQTTTDQNAPENGASAVRHLQAANVTVADHIDLLLIVYLYLRSPLNTGLKPSVFVVGRILRAISPKIQTPYLEKLRKAAIQREHTDKENPTASMTHREPSHAGKARLSALGFIQATNTKPTATGTALIKAIHQYANDVRRSMDIEIAGKGAKEFGTITDNNTIVIFELTSRNEVARFTAPEDLPKRTAPENRKNPHQLSTKHSKDFMDAVSKGMKKTGLPKRELVETAVYEYLERQGISIEDAVS